MSEYGIINEVGDLGLGFTPLNEQDNKVVNEQQQNNNKDDKENE